jgi:hypothetical protein
MAAPHNSDIMRRDEAWGTWCWTAPTATPLEAVIDGGWLAIKFQHLRKLDRVEVVEAAGAWFATGIIVDVDRDAKAPVIRWTDLRDLSATPKCGPDWSAATVEARGDRHVVVLRGEVVKEFDSPSLGEAWLRLKSEVA